MAIPGLAIAGGALAAGGLAGSMFGKKKKAKIDTVAYQDMIRGGSQRQRDLIGQQFYDLQPLSQNFQEKRAALSGSIQPEYQKIADQLKAGLAGVSPMEERASERMLDLQQQRAARNMPMMQQAMREQLAAGGQLRTGGAVRAMQQPVEQFQQQQSDLGAQLSAERLARDAARAETGVTQEAALAKEALSTKLGLDQNTMDTLLSMGRTDLIDKMAALRGVEQDEVNAMLSLLGIQTQTSLANTATENERRAAMWGELTQLGGTLLGAGLGRTGGANQGAANYLSKTG